MKIINTQIVDGRIELPFANAADGAMVTVLVHEGEPSFALSDEELRELQKSLDQASRGEVVDAWELLASLSE